MPLTHSRGNARLADAAAHTRTRPGRHAQTHRRTRSPEAAAARPPARCGRRGARLVARAGRSASSPAICRGSTIRAITWSRSPTTIIPTLLRKGQNPPAALFVVGEPALLWSPQIAIVGARSATTAGLDNARAFARDIRAGRQHRDQRPGRRHRQRRACRRARCGRQDDRGDGHRSGYRLSAASCGTGQAHRRQWCAGDGISAGHDRETRTFPAPQPHHRGAESRHAGGRGEPEIRIADHRAPGQRAGPRRVRAARFDPQPDSARMPQADPRRRASWSKPPRKCSRNCTRPVPCSPTHCVSA